MELPDISIDAGGRVRGSQITTLGDYKIVGFDRTLLVETVGDGSGTFDENKYSMGVTTGKYMIRQSKRFHPYLSGKSQIVECTFDKFHKEAGITKRVGYFSSSAVAPYTTNLDGFFLENDGTDLYIKAYRNGVETVNVPTGNWDGWSRAHRYDWSFFTTILFDFLWLGGAILRLWLKTDEGFVLLHTVNYSGTALNTFIKSPHQPIRYEIRSASGGGTFRYICCQVGTEGSIQESGTTLSVDVGTTGISLAAAGTVYPVKAIRCQSALREIPVEIENVCIMVTTANDSVLWSLQKNPTLSAPLTYANLANSSIQHANGNGVITVTAEGVKILSGYLPHDAPIPYEVFHENFMTWLSGSITNVMDEMVLCAAPLTNNLSCLGGITIKEF